VLDGELSFDFTADRCAELALIRTRDGGPGFAELDPPLPVGLEEVSGRRILQRIGRGFRMGNQGDIRELVER
jgi:hypothetical protein